MTTDLADPSADSEVEQYKLCPTCRYATPAWRDRCHHCLNDVANAQINKELVDRAPKEEPAPMPHIDPAEAELVEMPFDRIMPAAEAGEVDAGLIIHESRFTYPQHGLHKVVDLGEWWEAELYGRRGLCPANYVQLL